MQPFIVGDRPFLSVLPTAGQAISQGKMVITALSARAL
jgi:hypothetical protein